MSALEDLTSLADARLAERFSDTREIERLLQGRLLELRDELVSRARLHFLHYEKNPNYSSSNFTGTELKFHSSTSYEVAVNMVEARSPSQFISTLASDMILSNIGDHELSIDTYRLPVGWSHEVFNPGVVLEPSEKHRLNPGATLFLCSATQVPRIIPPAGEPALMLKIAGSKLRSLIWNFDPVSLRAQFTAASWVTGQRLKVAAKVLGAVEGDWNREKVIPALRRILGDENHDVRWAALESLCLLDSELGTKHLREATADPHPHIASTAARTLDRLGIARA
jgi:HEAT repeats